MLDWKGGHIELGDMIRITGLRNDKIGINIPQMLFERGQDAQSFADELQMKLNIPKEHITVKARKYTR